MSTSTKNGKQHYADGLYKRAAEVTGFNDGTLRQFASLSSQFELLCRHNTLSYQHHREVASIKLIAEDAKGKLSLSDEADRDKITDLLGEAEVALAETLHEAMKKGDVKAERNGNGHSAYMLLPSNNTLNPKTVNRWRQLAEIPARQRATYYAGEQRPTRNGLLRWRDSEGWA